ncbi:MAG: cytochrome P450 [Kiritimatiellia bacterium]|jgi:cytochrome P450
MLIGYGRILTGTISESKMEKDSAPAILDLANFDPHAKAFINNPYPSYRWFRDNEPVFWVEKDYQSFWVFRHEDVKQVLDSPDIWVKEVGAESGHQNSPLTKSLFASDGERHAQLRELLGPLFRESIDNLDSTILSITEGLVPSAKPGDSFNLISEYTQPLPSQTLAHVLGIRQESWANIEQLVAKVILANDPTRGNLVKGVGGVAMLSMRLGALAAALVEENDVLNVALQALLKIPEQLLPGKMISLMVDLAESSKGIDAGFTIRDVSANSMSLALAGYFTTTHVMGTGLVNLLNHPESLLTVRKSFEDNSSSDIMPGVVNEMLRYDPPIHVIDRFANETTQLGGVTIEKGQKIAAVVGSANRDADVFEDPDRFDISRDTSALLSFGHGVHQCLGAQMLRQELPIALECLLTKFPSFEISEAPTWQTDPYFRGYSDLQLRFK